PPIRRLGLPRGRGTWDPAVRSRQAGANGGTMAGSSAGRLEGQVAIVTGGSKGIGRAIAAAFAENGATVVITSRKAETGEATAAELGPSVTWIGGNAG